MERISAGIRKNQPKDRPRRELVQALRGSQPCGIAIVCFSLISGQPLAMAQETPEPAPSTGIPSVVGPLPPLQLAPPQLAPPELAPPRIPTSQLPPLQIGPSSQIELKRWNEIPRSGIVLDAGPREAMESAEPASPFQAAQRSVPAPFQIGRAHV